MRIRSSETKKDILKFIKEFALANDRFPSTREIAEKHGMSKSTAYFYLKEMDRTGLLQYADGCISLTAEKLSTAREPVQLLGSIPCGNPESEDSNVELSTTLPTAVFGRGPFYMLHATGDSMEDEEIRDGDLLVIRRQDHAQVGQIVVALDENNQNTLKRYGGIDTENGCAVLEYCNAAVYGDKKIYVPTLVCQGVLSHIIKER